MRKVAPYSTADVLGHVIFTTKEKLLDQTLFNWHDLVLLLTSFECFAVSLIICSQRRPLPHSLGLLALLLVSYGCVALNEIILWGTTFRYWVLDTSANAFFSLSFSYFCIGPLLWLFAKKLTQQHVKPWLWTLHFTPVICFLVYVWLTFWSLGEAEKFQLIEAYKFDNSWHYPLVELLSRIQRWLYTLLAIRLLWPQLSVGKQSLKISQSVGRTLFITMLVTISLELLLASLRLFGVTDIVPVSWSKIFGLTINYLNFILINLFLYAWLAPLYSKMVSPVNKTIEPLVQDGHIQAIESGIHHQHLYQNPHLSVERFAEAVGLSSKELSYTINRHYGMNFLEFINQHRIQTAKGLLEDQGNDHKSITEIFYQAGFNSKSVYNTLYKKTFNCTPSQFRKAVQKTRSSSG